MAGEDNKGKTIIISDSPQPILPTYSTEIGAFVAAQPFDMGAGPSRPPRVPAIRDFPFGCGPAGHIPGPENWRPEESEPTIETYGSWTSYGSSTDSQPQTGVAPRARKTARISVRPSCQNRGVDWTELFAPPMMPPHVPPVSYPHIEPPEIDMRARHSFHMGYHGPYKDPYFLATRFSSISQLKSANISQDRYR
jgi:hypothetical protein